MSKCRFIRWSCISRTTKEEPQEEADGGGSPCSRILLADDDTVRIYDVNDKRWSATIEKTASNFGKIADAAFGHVPNEVLVFSDFGVKLTIWSLMTCRGVEIRDPKYMVQCYSIRPRTGHLAILTRPAAQDILMILNPGDQSLYKSVELPTLDAQEVAWSPDSCWLAIRDTASSGHKVLIYTADGHLFRTYTGDEDAGDIGLGVKRMQWNSCNGSLVLGDYNDNVTILSKNVVCESAPRWLTRPKADLNSSLLSQSSTIQPLFKCIRYRYGRSSLTLQVLAATLQRHSLQVRHPQYRSRNRTIPHTASPSSRPTWMAL